MSVKLLFFASLRERIGAGAEDLELPQGIDTVAALRAHLASRGEGWSALAEGRNLRAAVNHAMARGDTPVRDGDEVAFFPPVTGG